MQITLERLWDLINMKRSQPGVRDRLAELNVAIVHISPDMGGERIFLLICEVVEEQKQKKIQTRNMVS